MKIMINSNIPKKLSELKKIKSNINNILKNTVEEATIKAINKAVELTPPNSERGVGLVTGNLKAAWSRDSITKAYKKGNKFITLLCNNELYASFVDQGHRLTRHFVPGLMINSKTGLLEKSPSGLEGGIIVGTKTTYIPGSYMVDGAVKEFNLYTEKLLDELIKKAFNNE